MTDQIKQLETLIAEYDAIHGKGKGAEIFGALLLSHGIDGQLDVFRRAEGRKIVLEADPDHPDAPDLVVIHYR